MLKTGGFAICCRIGYICPMLLEIFGFLQMSLTDILDILMVAAIIYLAFRWIKGSAALNIFIAIMSLFFLEVIVSALDMKLMSKLLGTLLDVGVLALIVIFQPEIRRFLIKLGSSTDVGRRVRRGIGRLFGMKDDGIGSEARKEIYSALKTMSEQRTGALIVIQREDNLEYIVETGDRIDAAIESRLLLNLFFKNSPLHDGAVVIHGDRIVAARCTLPNTSRTDLPPRYGMRHKAAIGMTEESDATVLVVSEETGEISIVNDGQMRPLRSIEDLK